MSNPRPAANPANAVKTKTQDQIRAELDKINKEFGIEYTMDEKEVALKLFDKPKKLKHYEPIQQDDKKQVRVKR